MTIEKLEPLARRPHWVAIHFSDGTVLKTQDYVVADQGLFTGQALSEAEHQALLEAVGRKRGFLVSGGEVDTERAARVVLEEYRSGKLGRFTLDVPPEEEQP